jgi:hypothetical protein
MNQNGNPPTIVHWETSPCAKRVGARPSPGAATQAAKRQREPTKDLTPANTPGPGTGAPNLVRPSFRAKRPGVRRPARRSFSEGGPSAAFAGNRPVNDDVISGGNMLTRPRTVEIRTLNSEKRQRTGRTPGRYRAIRRTPANV